MNSDKAAAVRDSINACPPVVDLEEDLIEHDGDPHTTRRGSIERTIAGDRVKPERSMFRPAYVEESGTVGDGDGATRPVFVVVLEPLWTKQGTALSVSPELVYEVAKHDCRIRVYPPDHRHGESVWITDHFSEDLTNTDGDRCPDCGSTYFKIRDGVPECARCGATEESVQTTLTEVEA